MHSSDTASSTNPTCGVRNAKRRRDAHAAHCTYGVRRDTLPPQFQGGIGLKLHRERMRRRDAFVAQIAFE
jgi:hypothetical protein